jgi:tetratricopeptide (TPR) repeat protein
VRRALAVLALAFVTALAAPARASSAADLVEMAHAHERAREDDIAIRRYMEALALDPTCEEAYLGLGALRARRGDLREADRVYSVAIEHRPQLREAFARRAFVRRALGMRAEAIADLLAGAEEDPKALRILAGWHGEDGQPPAQLAVWRKIEARAEATQDRVLENEARRMVKALVILVGSADPAASPPEAHGARREAAAVARRGG